MVFCLIKTVIKKNYVLLRVVHETKYRQNISDVAFQFKRDRFIDKVKNKIKKVYLVNLDNILMKI